eukprot:TRINITY_DN74334_c0_g1_i1.p1 TRINITY_DN74334_c0_g1~~TRINITY_DN74334_c0_g1_i1.p1  ORF type:complete len:410 (-),score=111.39 TRINITY_DN74334_c0_g1_i1:162-1391(-)
MLGMSGKMINMDGSDDPGYRYTMPALEVKHEGASKMKKSVLVNLSEVSRAVGRPAGYLSTYLGQSLSAASNVGKAGSKAYLAGHHDRQDMQRHVVTFIQEFVMCKRCNNPETSCEVEGNKKKRQLFLSCKSCGGRSNLDSSDKFVKYMSQHLPQDADHGHAQHVRGATATTMQIASEMADSAEVAGKGEKKKEKHKCPGCGHRSTKLVCSKCGAGMMNSNGDETRSTVETLDDQVSGPLLVRQWMQARTDEDSISDLLGDFESTMKSHDFRMSTSEQLAAVVEVLVAETAAECNIASEKMQPKTFSDKASSAVTKWSSLIDDLYVKAGGPAGLLAIIAGARKAVADIFAVDGGKESVVIGMLLCLRDSIDNIIDDDILEGCKKLASPGVAMQKFIQFLEEDSDDESGAE